MKARKLLAMLLVLCTLLTLAACQGKNTEVSNAEDPMQDEVLESPSLETDAPEETPEAEAKEETPSAKPSEKPSAKPAEKPVETPAEKPAETPAEKPAEVPEAKPTEKPADPTPAQPASVGQALLADFRAKATSAGSAEALADALVKNPILPFSGATMPVEPGFLAGFGDTEIKGFEKGVMFGPVIGAIPFVGYVFELENGTDASAFISTLKSSADLRWNICVEADEMVAGHAGNKVFFVMCPKEFSEE